MGCARLRALEAAAAGTFLAGFSAVFTPRFMGYLSANAHKRQYLLVCLVAEDLAASLVWVVHIFEAAAAGTSLAGFSAVCTTFRGLSAGKSLTKSITCWYALWQILQPGCAHFVAVEGAATGARAQRLLCGAVAQAVA